MSSNAEVVRRPTKPLVMKLDPVNPLIRFTLASYGFPSLGDRRRVPPDSDFRFFIPIFCLTTKDLLALFRNDALLFAGKSFQLYRNDVRKSKDVTGPNAGKGTTIEAGCITRITDRVARKGADG